LLLITTTFEATDPRDHVYALLGLATDVGPEQLGILPDYTLATAAVFENLTIRMVRQGQYLDVLNYANSKLNRHMNLATWVPAWDVHEDAYPLIPLRMRWKPDDLRSENLFQNYSAAPSTGSNDVLFSADSKSLRLTGCRLGAVETFGDVR
jgi:hypothetical protein